MWIVRLALRRPFPFIFIVGGLAILTTPTDIFSFTNIPGMSPGDMAKRVLLISATGTILDDNQVTIDEAYRGNVNPQHIPLTR